MPGGLAVCTLVVLREVLGSNPAEGVCGRWEASVGHTQASTEYRFPAQETPGKKKNGEIVNSSRTKKDLPEMASKSSI